MYLNLGLSILSCLDQLFLVKFAPSLVWVLHGVFTEFYVIANHASKLQNCYEKDSYDSV